MSWESYVAPTYTNNHEEIVSDPSTNQKYYPDLNTDWYNTIDGTDSNGNPTQTLELKGEYTQE